MKTLKIALLAAAAMSLSACTVGHERVEGMLAADQYTDIEVGGNAWFGCGKGDDATQTFKAHKAGYEVKGVVCGHVAPWGKAPIIRITHTKKL